VTHDQESLIGPSSYRRRWRGLSEIIRSIDSNTFYNFILKVIVRDKCVGDGRPTIFGGPVQRVRYLHHYKTSRENERHSIDIATKPDEIIVAGLI